MLRLLVDTSVWLDVAADIRGETLIAATRALVHQGNLQLLVPQVVIDEYDRNRERAVARLGSSTRTHLKLVRAVLAKHGRTDLTEELDQVAVHGPLTEEFVVSRFAEVRDLLADGVTIAPSEAAYRAVVRRGLDQRAPFHSKPGSVADALLIEMYAGAVEQAQGVDARFGFVTHNTRDFSDPTDARNPHPDLAAMFAAEDSDFFTSLHDAYAACFPDEFPDLIEELDFVAEARSGREILAAEERLFDLIWYQRAFGRMGESVERGRFRVEATYPEDDLGPYTDFQWGMLNGKLSALRWVMGDEWDFLDT